MLYKRLNLPFSNVFFIIYLVHVTTMIYKFLKILSLSIILFPCSADAQISSFELKILTDVSDTFKYNYFIGSINVSSSTSKIRNLEKCNKNTYCNSVLEKKLSNNLYQLTF